MVGLTFSFLRYGGLHRVRAGYRFTSPTNASIIISTLPT